MPDQNPSVLWGGDVNVTVVAIVVAIVAVVVFVVWRGTHDLDFNWGKADLRVRVKASRPPSRRARKRPKARSSPATRRKRAEDATIVGRAAEDVPGDVH